MWLEITNLDSGYGHVQVLRQVSLGVNAGEIVALIGANGAGKTTLLRTLSGIIRRSKGLVTFDGADIQDWTPEKIVAAGVAQIPERRQLFGAMKMVQVRARIIFAGKTTARGIHWRGVELKTRVGNCQAIIFETFAFRRRA